MEIEIEARIIFKPNDDISDMFASEDESSKTSYIWIKKANGQDVYKRVRSFRKDGLDVVVSQVKRGIEIVTDGCGLALEYDEEDAIYAERLFLKYDFCLLSSRRPLLSVYPKLIPTYRTCPFLKQLSEKATIDQVVLPNGRKIYIIEIEFSEIAEARKGATELWNEMSKYGRLMKLRTFNKSRLIPKHPNHKSTMKSIERLYGW